MLLIALSFGLSMAFLGLLWRSMLTVREAQLFQKSSVSYYAAEAGLQSALSFLESNDSGVDHWSGKCGDGIFDATIQARGTGYIIISKGYYYPKALKDEPLSPILQRFDRAGGGFKCLIKAGGEVAGGRFAMDAWEKY